jgi:hypothetical protein
VVAEAAADIKKIALKFIDKKYDRTHPSMQVKNNCVSSVSHDVASTLVTPERATNCHERRQRPWQASRIFSLQFFSMGGVSTPKSAPKHEFLQIAHVRHRI